MSMEEKLERFKEIIDQHHRIVFFGGAGVSTASGIPDFRSSAGLYAEDQHRQLPAEIIVSASFFQKNPAQFFQFYFDKLVYPEAKPNIAHQFMAQLEKQGKNIQIVTQNIDNLHEQAGSSHVHHLHGTTEHNYCINCGRYYNYEELILDESGIPRCSADQGIVRPDVTLYGEQLDVTVVDQAIRVMKEAEVLIVAGTSLVVYPAAGLIDYFNGQHAIVINNQPIRTHRLEPLLFIQDMTDVFSVLS